MKRIEEATAGVRVGHESGKRNPTAIGHGLRFLIPHGFSKVCMMRGFGWFRSGVQASGRAPAALGERAVAHTCFHCDLPLPLPMAHWVEFDGARRPLCCASCLAAAAMLIANGFFAYYSQRNA